MKQKRKRAKSVEATTGIAQHEEEFPAGETLDLSQKEVFDDPFATIDFQEQGRTSVEYVGATQSDQTDVGEETDLALLLCGKTLTREYRTSSNVWRVETEISLNRRRWFFQTRLLKNGIEQDKKRRDRASEIVDLDITEDLRRGLAQEALESHLTQCKALEAHMAAFPPPVPDRSRIRRAATILSILVVPVLLLLLISSWSGWMSLSTPDASPQHSTHTPPDLGLSDPIIPEMPECADDPEDALHLGQAALEANELEKSRGPFDAAAGCGPEFSLRAAAILDPAVIWPGRKTPTDPWYAVRYYGLAIRQKQRRDEIYKRLGRLLEWARTNRPDDEELQSIIEIYIRIVAVRDARTTIVGHTAQRA